MCDVVVLVFVIFIACTVDTNKKNCFNNNVVLVFVIFYCLHCGHKWEKLLQQQWHLYKHDSPISCIVASRRGSLYQVWDFYPITNTAWVWYSCKPCWLDRASWNLAPMLLWVWRIFKFTLMVVMVRPRCDLGPPSCDLQYKKTCLGQKFGRRVNFRGVWNIFLGEDS